MNRTKYEDAPERVVAKVIERSLLQPDGCLKWPGNDKPDGYGQISYRAAGSRKVALYVHRLMYVKFVGSIPDGLQVDHVCHDPEVCRPANAADCPHRRCVNLDHLALATAKVNTLRSNSRSAINANKERCPQGHDYRVIHHRDGSTSRRCQPCNTIAKREELSRRRDEISARKRGRAAELRAAKMTDEMRAEVQAIDAAISVMRSGEARAIRVSMGLSQAKFGEMFGTTQSAVQSWETGHRRPTGPVGAAYSTFVLGRSSTYEAA